jgi:hypothetical protein
MTKLPPPTSPKLAKELAARAAERLQGNSKEKYGSALTESSAKKPSHSHSGASGKTRSA